MADELFCPLCAAELVQSPGERPRCSRCEFVLFRDPKVAVGALLERGSNLLLVRRAIDPGMGLWSFPAGFVDRNETPEDALRREVKEELNLDVEIGPLVGVYSEAGNPVILIAYSATIRPDSPELVVGDENSDVAEFPPDAFPPMAFSHDRQIVEDWKRLRGRRATVR